MMGMEQQQEKSCLVNAYAADWLAWTSLLMLSSWGCSVFEAIDQSCTGRMPMSSDAMFLSRHLNMMTLVVGTVCNRTANTKCCGQSPIQMTLVLLQMCVHLGDVSVAQQEHAPRQTPACTATQAVCIP